MLRRFRFFIVCLLLATMSYCPIYSTMLPCQECIHPFCSSPRPVAVMIYVAFSHCLSVTPWHCVERGSIEGHYWLVVEMVFRLRQGSARWSISAM
jgi:hypothetical protein